MKTKKKKVAAKPAKPVGSCSAGATRLAADQLRDIVNFVNVMKNEEAEGETNKIHPEVAEELLEKLQVLAKKIGAICK